MAHANIFQRLTGKDKNHNFDTQNSSQRTNQPRYNHQDPTIETIQLLSEQVLAMREIIEEQNSVIEDLNSSVSRLKEEQKETMQNLNLAYIDQKDLAKQFRVLKSSIQANEFSNKQIASNRSRAKTQQQTMPQRNLNNEDQEIEELFFNNIKQSPVMKNAEASDAIKKTLAELKKLEKPKQRFLAKKEMEQREARQQTINQVALQQRPTKQKTIQEKSQRRLSNEELAKKIIFSKTPKFMRP